MKLMFSSCMPIDHGGYPNQLHTIIKKIIEYNNSIQISIVCWNINVQQRDYPLKLDDFDIDKDILVEKGDVYKNISFYIPGNYNDFWIKIEKYYNDFKPDIILFYQDILTLENYNIGKLNCKKYLWLPIHDNFKEHRLLPPEFSDPKGIYRNSTFRFLPIFDKIATFSQFGIRVLQSYNYNPEFINHTIDHNIFYKKFSKVEKKKSMGIDSDTFVCLMVASNSELSNRKAFDSNLIAFQRFAKNKKTILVLKTNLKGAANLESVINVIGINDKVINVPNKINTDSLVGLYCMADVLLAASKSEGFGIPVVEAQFCGTPVITTNCTAMPENTFLGVCTEPKDISLKIQGLNSWSNPDIESIVKALDMIYSGNFPRKEIPPTKYDIEFVFKDWIKFLEIPKAD